MVDLKSLKNRLKLAVVTALSPLIKQDTRWNSIYRMLLRYLEMCESTDHFKECIGLNASTRALIPTHEGADNEHDEIKKLSMILKKFHDVSKYLQYDDDDKVSVDRVRFYFNKLKTQHPEIDIYLSDDGINVHNIDFENAIAKIQRSKASNDTTVDLTRKEKDAVQIFLIGNEEESDSEAEEIERSFVDIADEEFEQQVNKKNKREFPYRSTAHVAVTSVIVERLFSRCGIIMRPHRRLMDPSTMETLIMLRFNKDLWDEHELDILMKRAAYGTRLSDSMTNEQLTTPVSSSSSTSEASSSSSSSRC